MSSRNVIELAGPDGRRILVELDDEPNASATAAAGSSGARPVPAALGFGGARAASIGFDDAIGNLRSIAQSVMAQLDGLGVGEAKVELSARFTADANLMIAKATGEGQLKVTLTWKPKAGNG